MTDAWRVVVSTSAFVDLAGAVSYIRDTLCAPAAVTTFENEFFTRAEGLSELPRAWPLVRDPDFAARGYRWCDVRNYMLFYTVDDEHHTVNILRLLHGTRDWQSLL